MFASFPDFSKAIAEVVKTKAHRSEAAVRALMFDQGLTWREVSQKYGAATSSLFAALKSGNPNARTIARCVRWLSSKGVTGPSGRPLTAGDLLD